MKKVKITHKSTNMVIAEGPLRWGITSFEGNFYIQKKYLKSGKFKINFIPGLCSYKFLYVWMDLVLNEGVTMKGIGWMYVIPNPIFPFIWYRVGIPKRHREFEVEYTE